MGPPSIMPKTARFTIERAASKAKIKEAGIDLSEVDLADFLAELNAMMFEQEASGITLGWAEIVDLDEEISTPMWADLYVQNSLAMHMVAEYGIPSPIELQGAFDRSERVVEKNVIGTPQVRFPNILPTGQQRTGYNSGLTFFPDETVNQIQNNQGVALTDEEGDALYHE